jgi:hypothetical protein
MSVAQSIFDRLPGQYCCRNNQKDGLMCQIQCDCNHYSMPRVCVLGQEPMWYLELTTGSNSIRESETIKGAGATFFPVGDQPRKVVRRERV